MSAPPFLLLEKEVIIMANTQKKDNVVFKKKKGFTQVQNWAPDDMTLSDKALGLYTRIQRWITFEAEDFICSKSFIKTKTPSGEKAFDSAWNELKERGYLKMYCQMFPRATWTAELLDEPQPDTPHTYYINAHGEVTQTNVEMALKREKSRSPQKGGTGRKSRTPHKGGTGNGSTENGPSGTGSTGNGGNNIITSFNTSFNTSSNTLDNTNLSINQSSDNTPNVNHSVKKTSTDRMIDGDLINEIKNQISYELLVQDGKMQDAICKEDLDMAIEALAILKTASLPQEFSGTTYSADYIRHRADLIKMEHIQYVFECFYERRDKIFNIKSYLVTSIFNAPASMGAYYANSARAKGLF